jgi:hypothetical protein
MNQAEYMANVKSPAIRPGRIVNDAMRVHRTTKWLWSDSSRECGEESVVTPRVRNLTCEWLWRNGK